MHLWLTQTQAPDAGGWTITTFIALAGAMISLVTLITTTYFTGRREHLKWAREALAEAFYKYIDVSYRAKDTGRRLRQMPVTTVTREQENEAATKITEIREEMLDLQTRITLLAPQDTFERSQDLRWRVDALLAGTSNKVPQEKYRNLEQTLAEARFRFVESAKKSLGLPR